jgi:hypothetical protein
MRNNSGGWFQFKAGHATSGCFGSRIQDVFQRFKRGCERFEDSRDLRCVGGLCKKSCCGSCYIPLKKLERRRMSFYLLNIFICKFADFFTTETHKFSDDLFIRCRLLALSIQ